MREHAQIARQLTSDAPYMPRQGQQSLHQHNQQTARRTLPQGAGIANRLIIRTAEALTNCVGVGVGRGSPHRRQYFRV